MAAQGILGKIFSVGAEKLVDSLGKAIDRNFTSKEEKLKAELDIQKVVTENIREMEKLSIEQFKAEVEDRSSARTRETEFVKALGHVDWMMYFTGVVGLAAFGFVLYVLVYVTMPESNRELFIHAIGMVEGVAVSIFSFYFGSSQGSRLKDKISNKSTP